MKTKKLPRNGVKAYAWHCKYMGVWAARPDINVTNNPCRIFSEERAKELLKIEKRYKSLLSKRY